MGAAAGEVVEQIQETLRAAGEVAMGLRHEALAPCHGRLDRLIAELVAARPAPGLAREVRRALETHRALLQSLNDTLGRALERASHTPAACYSAGGGLESAARPLLTTQA